MIATFSHRIKRFLVARGTILVILLLLTLCVAAANIVPQRVRESDGMTGAPAAAGGFARLVTAVGLDHVFSTWWFVALTLLFLASLLASTGDQYRLARGRSLQRPVPGGGEEGCPVLVSPEGLAAALGREGYRLMAEADGARRYVRAVWGYWGNVLLHLGMVVVVIFSLVYILTEHRVIAQVVGGEPLDLRSGLPERRGLLARPLPLPETVVLDRLIPQFWANDSLKSLDSELTFKNAGRAEPFAVGVNDKGRYRGMIVYQRNNFGTAFLLEYSRDGVRPERRVFYLPMPLRREKAAYGNDTIDGYLLKAKYYASPDRKRMLPVEPILTLRLMQGEGGLGEASLRPGETGTIGPYRITLHDARWWTELLFEGSRGTAGIFTGFALLLVGGALAYFVAPREVVVVTGEGGTRAWWRAVRFTDFYRAERERIHSLCKGDNTP